ncbi:MAG: acyltransferase family protein [Oligoflexia bacterium]|nr:acyltransferase family protein [Oligoflexia bacterium]
MVARVLKPRFRPRYRYEQQIKVKESEKDKNKDTTIFSNSFVNHHNYHKSQNSQNNTSKQLFMLKERRSKIDYEEKFSIPDISAIKSLSPEFRREMLKMISPWEWLCNPTFLGLENIPKEGPVLFVANHTLMAILDIVCLSKKLFESKGIALNILADHYHYKIPYWRDFLYRIGVVDGTRANCSYLMKEKQYLLVFPGGAREAFKLKGEKYTLIWKQRSGFAHMAIKHQCPIIPVSSVGPEECYDILIDNQEIYNSPLGRLFKTIGYKQENIFPVVKGIGPTIIPKPQKFYIKFGKPIDTSSLNGECDNIQYCIDIYDYTKNEIQRGIDELLILRSDNDQSEIVKRLKDKLLEISIDQIVKFLTK